MNFSANLPGHDPDAEFRELMAQCLFWGDQLAALAADCNAHLQSAIASCERISANNRAMLASQAEMIRALGGNPAAPAAAPTPDFRKESSSTPEGNERQRPPVVMLPVEKLRRLKPFPMLTGWEGTPNSGTEPPAQLNQAT